jgi:hypothetical protein
MDKRISAGDEIDSYCTRCKLTLGHIIIAVVGEKIVKMQCRTCNSIHGHRSGVAAKRSSGGGRTAAAGKKPDPVQTLFALWERCIAGAESGREVPYAMDKSYKEEDIVSHPLFGKGVVQKTHYRKCRMLFRDGEKTLVSSNT